MLKKIISLLVIFAMLVPFSSAVAADEPTSHPTIEEILNEYHQKAFEAKTANDNGGASTLSRSGSGSSKTLEQETVDTLTAAGYEAYNVTADNYTNLEASLNTDFAEMGLDPEGSYIVVINSESSQSANSRAVGGSDIVQDPGDLGGGSDTTFTYTYGEKTYLMRYVTVTAADDERYCAADSAVLISASATSAAINDAINSFFYFGLDQIPTKIGLGTIAEICGIEISNINLRFSKSLALNTCVEWVREYTQVYYENVDLWSNRSSVDYALVINWFTGWYYNASGQMEKIDRTIPHFYYSEHYSDYSWRNRMAARGFVNDSYYHEYVGDIKVYNPSEEISLYNIPDPLFYFRQYIGLGP